MNRIYNWKPSPSDPRDFKLIDNYQLLEIDQLPLNMDLSGVIPETYDQGNEGCCTCTSTGKAILYASRLQNRPINPARNQIYYDVRQLEGIDPSDDSGAYIRDVFKCLKNIGAAHEELWPYDDKMYSIKPTQNVYDDALSTLAETYHSVNNTRLELLNAIGNLKKPVVFGFYVYESFEQGNWYSTTGVMPLPQPNEHLLGGHAVLLVGYRTLVSGDRQYLVKNSWGTRWGLKNEGLFWMDEAFITSLNCDDFWVLDSISNSIPVKQLDWLTVGKELFSTISELTYLKKSSLVKLGIKLDLPCSDKKTFKVNLELVRQKLKL